MTLDPLNQLIGSWELESTHPAFPGIVVRGTTEISWLEGNRFLIQRARVDHPDFPDYISILGDMGSSRADEGTTEPAWAMHYFDSRGVFRVYQLGMDTGVWRLWRDEPGFSQRFTGTFSHQGNTIAGKWELCRDEQTWNSDLAITYRRVS